MKLENIVAKKPLLESVQYGMTLEQRRIVEGIVREFMPIYEATLTKDQIDQLFGTIEKDPSSRTAIGKGVDVAKKANEIINNIGKWMSDTTPVKGADQKFEQLKGKVGAKFPELDKKLTGLGTWMKANPGKTAAIIGVMTALAGLAGGPIGGAIAGQVIRGATELIKGEKLSTAIGKGIKTAAIGALVGMGLEKIGDSIKDGIKFVQEKTGAGWVYSARMEVNGITTFDGVRMLKPEADLAGQINDQIYQAAMKDDTDALVRAIIKMEKLTELVGSDQYVAKVTDNVALGDTLARNANIAQQTFKDLGIVAQGAITGGMDTKKKQESVILQQRPLSEGQVYLVFQRLDEGPFDAVKKVAGKAAGAIGGAIAKGAKKVGTALTQKNTAQGLAKAWTKAGSPTDSDELYKFLLTQKINKDALDKIYGDMKFPVPQGVEEPEAEPAQGATDAGSTATGAEPQDTQEPATASTATGRSQDSADDTMAKAASTPGAPDDFKQAVQARQGGKVLQMPQRVDLNKLAQDIRAQGRETVQKIKIQLTKDLKSA